MSDKKVPITRLNKFFSGEDFAIDIEMGREWLEGDMNFKVVLYQIDRNNIDTDDVYGETGSGDIKFLPPVEVTGLVQIEAPTNENYGNSNLSQMERGNLTFSVYEKTLEELNIDIAYGDYLAYYQDEATPRYYSVVNDGRINNDNKHTYGGYKPFYRTIIAAPVTEDEFNGL